MLLSQGVDVCDYPCISQMQECIIHHGAIDCGGVEESQLCVARSVPIEIGMRERSGVQWGTVSGGVFRSFALEYNPIPHWGVLDEAGDFLFSVLIDEDKWVVFGVSSVTPQPGCSEFD